MNERYEKNTKGRDFVIGDLHGCFNLFTDLLEEIKFDTEIDRMFSVGDLIDRGDKSIDCLRLIKMPWFHSVVGNHEDMLIEYMIHGNSPNCWDANGGMWHYEADQDELRELALLVLRLPLAITVETRSGDVGICHAQPPTTNWNDAINPDERMAQIMLWARMLIEEPEAEDVKGVVMTFHGHTPVEKPRRVGNSLFIDTGAVFTRNLTCIPL